MKRLLCGLLLTVSAVAADSELTLWYRQPAATWGEALPVGNGRMGAMVFGGVQEERLQLNEGNIWSGKRKDYDRVGADNIFIFGLDAAAVQQLRAGGYDPHERYRGNPALRRSVSSDAAKSAKSCWRSAA